jgi:acyl-CoA dehydrogenase family protein 9
VLERLADMSIELYASACAIARTQKLIDEKGADGAAREIELCDLFCIEAGRRFRARRLALEGGEVEVDDRRRAIAAAVRDADGYFVIDAIQAVNGPAD